MEVKSITLDDRKRMSNNSIGGAYTNLHTLSSATGLNRIGIHQNHPDVMDIDLKAESRQMIQSPFKTKPIIKKGNEDQKTTSLGIISNQYLKNIGSVSKKQSLTLQKNLASSLKQTKGDQKSAHRTLINSTSV